MNGGTLNIILTHQDAPRVERMLAWWRRVVPSDSILLAHGGAAGHFAGIEWPRKIRVTSDRLQTTEHYKEMQSYTAIFRAVIDSGFLDSFETVHFAEYDQIPLQPALNERQRIHLASEKADVLGYRLQRTDRTNDGHYLSHWRLAEFRQLIEALSVRTDPSVVLSMLGFGSFWTCDAFRAVGQVAEPIPFYLEVFLPTVAHHLGFRVRPVPDSPEIASHIARPILFGEITEAARKGQWNTHPLKWLWDGPPPNELLTLLDSNATGLQVTRQA